MPSFTVTFNDEPEKQGLWGSKKSISFEDYLELTACVFNWADSYDAKVIFLGNGNNFVLTRSRIGHA